MLLVGATACATADGSDGDGGGGGSTGALGGTVLLTADPAELTLDPGARAGVTVMATDSQGTPVLLDSPLAWSSSADHVATLSSDGRISGEATGDATLTATFGDASVGVPVRVRGWSAQDVNLVDPGTYSYVAVANEGRGNGIAMSSVRESAGEWVQRLHTITDGVWSGSAPLWTGELTQPFIAPLGEGDHVVAWTSGNESGYSVYTDQNGFSPAASLPTIQYIDRALDTAPGEALILGARYESSILQLYAIDVTVAGASEPKLVADESLVDAFVSEGGEVLLVLQDDTLHYRTARRKSSTHPFVFSALPIPELESLACMKVSMNRRLDGVILWWEYGASVAHAMALRDGAPMGPTHSLNVADLACDAATTPSGRVLISRRTGEYTSRAFEIDLANGVVRPDGSEELTEGALHSTATGAFFIGTVAMRVQRFDDERGWQPAAEVSLPYWVDYFRALHFARDGSMLALVPTGDVAYGHTYFGVSYR